jgi:signal transduction histidine kinase
MQARVAVAFAVAGTVVVAVVLAAAVALAGARAAQQRVINEYYAATVLSNEAFLQVVEIESGVHAYLRTGDPTELRPLERAQQGTDSGVGGRLRALLARDQVSLEAFEEAAAATNAWFDWASPTVAAVRAGGPQAITADDVAEGERRFGQVDAAYHDYLDLLGQRRSAAVDALLRRMSVLFGAVVTAALVSGAAATFLWWAVRRWVARPLAGLACQTRLVRDGDLEHRVSASGPPEIAQLGRDVEAMRRRLVEQIAAARTATGELEEAKARLEEQTADLERSNRELEQFAYVASHDLQEPLRKVASFCQLLQKRYSGHLDDRADQYIEFAVDGAKRMQQLINDLLEFSRVGRLTSPETDVDLDACLDRALRDLEAAVEESGAVVTRDELPVVRGEAPLLGQLFMNLVGNALKFRSAEPPRIHLGARRVGDLWELSCSDNGIGIEPQYADRVFVIFQRLHPKEAYSGTGIGLAMCKKIVEYHGGSIWVDATGQGPGTTLRWTLPVPAAAPMVHDGVPVPVGAVPAVAAGPAGPGTTSNGPGGPHVA